MKFIYYLIIFFLLIVTIFVISSDNTLKFNGKIKNNFFVSPEKKKLNFLWSKGLQEKNDYMLDKTENISDNETIIKQIKEDIVWIRLGSKNKEETCDLDLFSKNLEILEKEIILVTSDGDKSVPGDLKKETYSKIINHPKIKKWYTQNYDKSEVNEKLKHYPIGFDLHTSRSFFGLPIPFLPKKSIVDKINYLLELRKNNKNKLKKIFSDVHLSCNQKFNNERKRVKEILNDSPYFYPLKIRTNQEDIWKKYSSYKFVISTHGNGLDCHRTWEIIFLGGIVITKTSSLDEIFQNLPVVIVKDWDECLKKENLDLWDKKYTPLTSEENINKYYLYDTWLK